MNETSSVSEVAASLAEKSTTTDVAKTALMAVGLLTAVWYGTGALAKLSRKLHTRKS